MRINKTTHPAVRHCIESSLPTHAQKSGEFHNRKADCSQSGSQISRLGPRDRQRRVAEAKEKVVEAAMIWYNKAYFNRPCEFLAEVALAKAAAALEAAALGR